MRYLYLFSFLFPLSLFAQDALFHYNQGVKAHNEGDYTNAINSYKKCLAENPEHAEAKQNMSVVYYNQSLVAFNKKDYDQALKRSYEALRYAPNNAEVYAMIGNAHIGQKDYQQAITDFTKALEISPQSADYYAARSWIYNDLMDNAHRLTDMEQAAKLAPDNAKYQFLAGKYKQSIDQERFKAALGNYNKAIELKADYLEAYVERATYYMTFGEFTKAIKDLKKAERLGGDVKHLMEAAKFELDMQKED
ncbi:MAG: tetratricopeptide repeat protein [Aureispira sp.]